MGRMCIAEPMPQLDNEEFGTANIQGEGDDEQPNRTANSD